MSTPTRDLDLGAIKARAETGETTMNDVLDLIAEIERLDSTGCPSVHPVHGKCYDLAGHYVEGDDAKRHYIATGDEFDEYDIYWTDAEATGGAINEPHTRGLPEGVTVTEEWAVRSDDGNFYKVDPPTREKAEYEATLLRHAEPGAAPACQYVMHTPWGGEAKSGWRWPATEEPVRTLTAVERRAEQEYIAPVGVDVMPDGWKDPNGEITDTEWASGAIDAKAAEAGEL